MKKFFLTTSLLALIAYVFSIGTASSGAWRDGIFYKSFTDTPFTGRFTGDNTKAWFIYGQIVGPYASYYGGGNLKAKGSFKDGREEGEWTYYYPSGALDRKQNHKSGWWDGPMTSYFENGQLKSKGGFKNSRKHGDWVVYLSNGTINAELSGTFKNGKKISD